ncbi:MAG: hypothetical protein HQL61_07970 [Magnetococcales bacterium]|nr:hypothetical protein [Nitrospirota bacterium]
MGTEILQSEVMSTDTIDKQSGKVEVEKDMGTGDSLEKKSTSVARRNDLDEIFADFTVKVLAVIREVVREEFDRELSKQHIDSDRL